MWLPAWRISWRRRVKAAGRSAFLNRPQWIAMAWDVWQAPAAVMVEKSMRYFRKDFLSWVMRVSA